LARESTHIADHRDVDILAALHRNDCLLCRLSVRLEYTKPSMPEFGGYFSGPEQAGALVPKLRLDNPSKVKASRADPRSSYPDYRATLKQAFYGDVDDASAEAATNFLQPDSPPVGVPIATTAPRWGALLRTYIVTEQDMAVRPALQHRFIREADEAFPGTKTEVRAMESSHYSCPNRRN
jgi:hypothetical protein